MELVRQSEAWIPTPWGKFRMMAYATYAGEPMPHIAMVHEHFVPGAPTLVRIHSECMTGDLFGSRRCDCGAQLTQSMEQCAQSAGIVIYLRQEGRGIGLINKLKAYELQDQGLDTIEANVHLGQAIDARSYQDALRILEDLGVRQLRLLTNNPGKIDAIEDSSIQLLERVPLVIPPVSENEKYLETKARAMGHLLHPATTKETSKKS